MNILKKEHIQTIYMLPGDSIVASIKDENGEVSAEVSHTIEAMREIDTIALFEADEFAGMTGVVGGAFGKSKDV